jgi:hypothetical protein
MHSGKLLTLTTIKEPRRRRRITRDDLEEVFLNRKQLAKRWGISVRQLIVKERAGELRPLRLSYRTVRYRLSDIVALEAAHQTQANRACRNERPE